MKPEEVFKYALYGTGIFAVYKVAQKVGIFQTAQESQDEATLQTTLTSNYWLPKFWKDYVNKYKKVMILTPAAQENLGNLLVQAKGTTDPFSSIFYGQSFIGDDEQKVYGVFRSMNYQTSLSSLADYWLKTYNQDLLSYLKEFLNEEELTNISKIIAKYKVGYSTDGGKTYK